MEILFAWNEDLRQCFNVLCVFKKPCSPDTCMAGNVQNQYSIIMAWKSSAEVKTFMAGSEHMADVCTHPNTQSLQKWIKFKPCAILPVLKGQLLALI